MVQTRSEARSTIGLAMGKQYPGAVSRRTRPSLLSYFRFLRLEDVSPRRYTPNRVETSSDHYPKDVQST